MKGIVIDTCPMTGKECWYCSQERAVGKKSTLKKDPYTGMMVKDAEVTAVLELGAWCNNDGRNWVCDMKVCPATLKPTKPFIPVRRKPGRPRTRV